MQDQVAHVFTIDHFNLLTVMFLFEDFEATTACEVTRNLSSAEIRLGLCGIQCRLVSLASSTDVVHGFLSSK